MKTSLPPWLFVVILLAIIIRIPTLHMPYSYGDETIYLTLGEGVRQGLTLYKDIHDNKPPLIYLLAALAGNLFWFKFSLLLINLISIFLFFQLTKQLFPQKSSLLKVSVIVFFLLTNLPLLEGNIVNSEILMLAPTLAALNIVLGKKTSHKRIFLAGLIFSIAPLLKLPAIFDIPAIFLFWLVSQKDINLKETRETIKRALIFSSGVALPILFTFLWYYTKGALGDYVKAAFLENMGYLSSWRGVSKSQAPFFVKNGPLLIRFVILSLGLLVLVILRKRLDKRFVFVSGWLFLAGFAAALSERPYPHYLIQAIPATSILLGYLFTETGRLQTLSIIPLTLFFSIPVYFRFWYYPSLPFYKNFLKLATGKVSKTTYINYFDANSERNYKIAQIIRESTSQDDRIFVWEDSAQIYALSKRLPPIKYVAGYHIRDFYSKEELIKNLNQKKPKVITILPESESFVELETFAETYYIKLDFPELKGKGVKFFYLPNTK